ncbi:guanitoxin biosynthesis L-enduracididine beta-hydroxylase GntD [Micromonospora sp. WMMA1976]|uniref:guanitoxin biosynthesis L-enduracididine beta-hydroxylase GntD n=1 Tax=Micromonospora sp. WMMA1976 TaxID=3014995 RepID=UPI00248B02D9|nr:guanitoxin biosynthesis L-enduracididine beta-hydroxylase GntD [Micromonospora sp. WMMA1976]WBC01117.1 guanitoxin biosynthesis L-enduracididine beta-hydroxylase GntD [Micromonospora sp. WMMA1976]
MSDNPQHYVLSPGDVIGIRQVAARLRESRMHPRDPRFYDEYWDLYAELPHDLRAFLERFRRIEEAPIAVVEGLPVNEDAVGLTPPDWETAAMDPTVHDHDALMAMCSLALGDPFTWSTLQSGAMIQDLLPIKGDEHRQNGYSSDVLLEFHTEDGFHPARCDYLMLFGVRNHDEVPTYVASISDVRLAEQDRRTLSEPRFYILPDDEHIRQLQQRYPDHPSLARAIEMQQAPAPVPVLFGDRLNPYLRIDRPFMRCDTGDVEGERALDSLIAELKRRQRSVVVEQGMLLIVDNYRAVHGRRAFRSRYDGTDRWLKRMIVSRDLRKAQADRSSTSRRVLF